MTEAGKESSRRTVSRVWMALILVPAIIACTITAGFCWSGSFYKQTNLVADKDGVAKYTDPKLVNSWGIIHSPTGPWWVNDNGTGFSTVYNGEGKPFPLDNPLVVTIPPPNSGTSTPTGIIYNGTKDFELAPDSPARFIFVTEDGTISGWNRDVPSPGSITATIKVDNSAKGAVYKGAAMGLKDGNLFLYVANFHAGTVETYDSSFKKVSLSKRAFTDDRIPSGYAPFNVINLNGCLIVTFAKQDAAKHDDVAGKGFGYVDMFDTSGRLMMRFQHGPWLNSPWGVALAPYNFGKFSKHILIGQFGSGQIAAFDPMTGKFDGLLRGTNEKPIVIDGLWGIGFGNGENAGPTNTLYFAAGPNDEGDGLFGTLTAVSKK